MTPDTPTPRSAGGPAPEDASRPSARGDNRGEPRPEPGEPGYPRGSEEAPAIETAEPAPAGSLKLKDRLVPSPPEMDTGGGRAVWFVFALIVVTALVMGAVLALNVIADPYGSVGTH